MAIDRRRMLGAVGLGAGMSVAAGVAAAVGGSATAASASAETTGAETADTAGGTGSTVRMATYNIHHGASVDEVLDLDRTAAVIAAARADVIALQEVDRHFRERSAFADQAAELARRLRLRYVFGANIDQDPLEPGQPRRQYGTALLTRWPILSSRNTLLPKEGDSEQRGLLEAVVEVAGRPIRFATTHMQHTSDEEWQEQADAIVERLGASSQPVVWGGDTNAVPSFAGIGTFTEAYADAWARVGIGPGLTTDQWRFDYVFVPRTSEVRHASLISSHASDHLALVVELML